MCVMKQRYVLYIIKIRDIELLKTLNICVHLVIINIKCYNFYTGTILYLSYEILTFSFLYWAVLIQETVYNNAYCRSRL